MGPTLLIVIPTYGHFEYASRAVMSALENTRTFEPYVVVVDDASPERLHRDYDVTSPASYDAFLLGLRHAMNEFGDDRVFRIEFEENGGLTRSWNAGLAAARATNADACCVTNSDVLFPPDWDREIFYGLHRAGHALVGPVTNAPGSNPEQYVGRYSVVYDRSARAPADVARVQAELLTEQRGRYRETTLNGFCMVARTETWWATAYDAQHVFRPRNDFNSKGEPNPTPLMTLNEYELQARWRAKGLTAAACLGSYVFHYRAVSRGDRHRRGDWARLPTEGQHDRHPDAVRPDRGDGGGDPPG